MKKLQHFKLLLSLMMLALVVLVLAGCSHVGKYFDFWDMERTQKKEYSIEPTAKLLRELQPGNTFMLVGPVNQKTNYEGPVLLVAVTDMFKKREIVVEKILQTPVLYYQAYLSEGNYDLYFFADLNGNGYFDAHEMIGQTSGAPINVRKKEVKDGLTFNGPAFTLDVNSPATTDLPIKVQVRDQEYVFRSLDDQFFDPQYGEIGMYDPKKLFAHTQRFMFALEKINPNKTMVIFVHGVAGTPRDFKYLVDGLDRNTLSAIVLLLSIRDAPAETGIAPVQHLEGFGRKRKFPYKAGYCRSPQHGWSDRAFRAKRIMPQRRAGLS